MSETKYLFKVDMENIKMTSGNVFFPVTITRETGEKVFPGKKVIPMRRKIYDAIRAMPDAEEDVIPDGEEKAMPNWKLKVLNILRTKVLKLVEENDSAEDMSIEDRLSFSDTEFSAH